MSDLSSLPVFLSLAYAFGMGFLSSLTPCVYPMIPITLSVIGVKTAQSRWQAFLRSSIYVSGIVLTYTVLGMICAKTGIMFGSLLGDPIIVLALSALLIILAMHSLDIFQLPLSGLQSRASKVGGKGACGAFLMGIVSGGVGAPCVGPVLVLLLVEAARSSNVAWGTALLFTYSIGLGIPFLVLGTFSPALAKLPRAGVWLYGVKFLIALGLLVTTLFFLHTLDLPVVQSLERSIPALAWVAAALGVACWSLRAIVKQSKYQQLASVSVLSLCVFFAAAGNDAHSSTLRNRISWKEDLQTALNLGERNNKVIMVDLYSKWCLACKELDQTFSDSDLAHAIQKTLVPARLDFTKRTEKTQKLSDQYGVLGLPTVLFLRPDGVEIPGSRIHDVLTPEEMIRHIARVASNHKQ